MPVVNFFLSPALYHYSAPVVSLTCTLVPLRSNAGFGSLFGKTVDAADGYPNELSEKGDDSLILSLLRKSPNDRGLPQITRMSRLIICVYPCHLWLLTEAEVERNVKKDIKEIALSIRPQPPAI